ncbi:MAG: isoprenylcysteine carboxylmethyltransferase family protein [Bacteroidota bacterium]|nr:isoprenylcysteine carboxylmethyltransferase family protein [Bacteroidota bacterium]
MKTIKIPPPILVIILTSLVYFSSTKLELIYLPYRQIVSVIILIIGLIVIVSPVVDFIKSKTTINPVKFKNVNRLVTTGIYRYSRNPMYLGMILIIISTTVYYLNFLSVFSPLIFYIWINKFQINREEIFLEDKFGSEYLKYKSKTRRWI